MIYEKFNGNEVLLFKDQVLEVLKVQKFCKFKVLEVKSLENSKL